MSLDMTDEERETFLADLHVGVISIADGSLGPLTLPIWYQFQDGQVVIITDSTSKKARLITECGRFTLCAQTEEAPYKYVSVEGPVTETRPADLESDLRPMARRYLGTDLGDGYVAGSTIVGQIVITMKPERWRTTDYSKEYSS